MNDLIFCNSPCCLTAPSNYRNHWWLAISKVSWHSVKGNIAGNARDVCPRHEFEITNRNFMNISQGPICQGHTRLFWYFLSFRSIWCLQSSRGRTRLSCITGSMTEELTQHIVSIKHYISLYIWSKPIQIYFGIASHGVEFHDKSTLNISEVNISSPVFCVKRT